MKTISILFVVVHLLVDLAIPSLPGAFRFNPDESVVAVRVQIAQAQDLDSVPQLGPPWMTVEVPRLEPKLSIGLRRTVNAPELIALLPRRDPSPNQSRHGSAEDH
jgi:hypothetical protein